MNNYLLFFDKTSVFLSHTPLFTDKYMYKAKNAHDAIEQHKKNTGEKRNILHIHKKIAPARWEHINIHSDLNKK